MQHTQSTHIWSLPVIVGALGYFVDVYDLLLFSTVRVQSLTDLGVAQADMFATGIYIINMQLAGLILGGLLFGVLGDKYGRSKLMFISIIVYSLATLANAFTQDVSHYAWLRFIAGIGLAGELGLAITLVAEILPKEKRGLGTMLVTGFGVSGAVLAGLMAHYVDWRTCYIIGALMGFSLLALRLRVAESFIYATQQHEQSQRGSLKMLLTNPDRIKRFCLCVMMGPPIMFVLWFTTTFAPEITKLLGLTTPITGAEAIMWAYIGLSLGDFAAGGLSQYFKTRKKVTLAFLLMGVFYMLYYFLVPHWDSRPWFLALYFAMGFSVGYLALQVTTSAEIFGTNLRATVATSVPNFMRACFLPISLGISALKEPLGLITAALIVGAISFAIAIFAVLKIRETFGIDLNYTEK